jgi:hypothetical protein
VVSRNKTVILVASGDSRLSANRTCWAAQLELEAAVGKAVTKLGYSIQRGHAVDPEKGHGFLDGQHNGIVAFRCIDPHSPLIVAEAVWQYSSHVLPGLIKHKGPILTLANWSGQWPGLVGLLNLNASLTKAGVEYSTIWSENFTDSFAQSFLEQWLRTGSAKHEIPHVRELATTSDAEAFFASSESSKLNWRTGFALGQQLRKDSAILGVFDEGCMGMYNAIIPDAILFATGIFKVF